MPTRDPDLAQIIRAMKARFGIQALQNIGFYLMHTRPILFYIVILFFLCGGERWLGASKHPITHQVRLDAFAVLTTQRRELFL